MTQDSRRQPDYEVSVQISIPFPDARSARAAMKALIPDNVNMPEGLSISMSLKGGTVQIIVTGSKTPMNTVVNTVDEILEHISVAKKLVEG